MNFLSIHSLSIFPNRTGCVVVNGIKREGSSGQTERLAS